MGGTVPPLSAFWLQESEASWQFANADLNILWITRQILRNIWKMLGAVGTSFNNSAGVRPKMTKQKLALATGYFLNMFPNVTTCGRGQLQSPKCPLEAVHIWCQQKMEGSRPPLPPISAKIRNWPTPEPLVRKNLKLAHPPSPRCQKSYFVKSWFSRRKYAYYNNLYL